MPRYEALVLLIPGLSQEECSQVPSVKQFQGQYGGFGILSNGTVRGFGGEDPPDDAVYWKIDLDIGKATNKFWETYAAEVNMKPLASQSLGSVGAGWGNEISFVTRGIRPSNSRSVFLRTALEADSFAATSGFARTAETIHQFVTEEAEDGLENDFTRSTMSSRCHVAGMLSRTNANLEARQYDTPPKDDGARRMHSSVISYLTGSVSPPLEGSSTYFEREPDMIGKFEISDACGLGDSAGRVLLVALRKLDPAYLTAQQTIAGLAFALKSMAEIWLYGQQFKLISAQPVLLKTSSWMIGLSVLHDAFEAQFFFSQQTRSLINMLSIAGILKILLVCLVEMKWLIILWKERAVQRHRQLTENADDPMGWIVEMNKGIRSSAALMVVVLLISSNVFHIAPELILIGFAFYMVPQIFMNAYHGHRHPLATIFIVGVAACRLVTPTLIWSGHLSQIWRCNTHSPSSSQVAGYSMTPSWFFDRPIPLEFVDLFGDIARRPSPIALTAIVCLISVQSIVLVLQSWWSPRVFIPAKVSEKYLPAVFDYEMDVARAAAARQDLDPNCTSVDCVICFTTIKFADYQCLVTPCQHFFHKECLLKWMEVKLECPTCRRLLPPY